jgi:hypothetical protein
VNWIETAHGTCLNNFERSAPPGLVAALGLVLLLRLPNDRIKISVRAFAWATQRSCLAILRGSFDAVREDHESRSLCDLHGTDFWQVF